MQAPRNSPDVGLLIDAYIDSSIDDDQFVELCDWLREDAEHRQAFARKLALHSEIAEWCVECSGSLLAGCMETAEAEEILPAIPNAAKETLTKQKYVAALSYVLEHTFTPKRVARLAKVATAAALLLTAALTIILLSAGPGEEEPIAELPETLWPRVEVPVVQRVTATLTTEHDAQWDRRPGEDLYAGHRFTLIQGYAEITTNDGAVAILEAPATIELLDNNNALRLHTGKLVGVCETDSSKGFIVHTPHMQITDLGTRFGVEADPAGTDIQVFDGIVEVVRDGSSTSTTPTTPQRVAQGQAVRALAGSATIARISADATAFVDLLDKTPTPLERLLKDDALIAAYLIGETDASGQTLTNIAETTGQAMAGLLKGKPQFIEGPRPGTTALRFKAQDKTHVILPNWNQHIPETQVSFAVWVRLSPGASEFNTVLSQWSADWPVTAPGSIRPDRLNLFIANTALDLGINVPAGPSRLCFQFFEKDSALPVLLDQARANAAALSDDTWIHVAFTVDPHRGSNLYLNGTLVDRVSGPIDGPVMPDSSLPLVLGGKPSGDVYFDGDMAQVLFLERALSSDEIHQLYQSTRPSANSPITFPTGQ